MVDYGGTLFVTMFIYIHNAGLLSASTHGKIMLMAGMSSSARNVKTEMTDRFTFICTTDP